MTLDELVRFESPTSSSDDLGRQTQGWTEEFTTKADYRRLRGSESVVGARLEGRQPTIITIRESSTARSILSSWRAVDVRTGEIFNIHVSIRSDNRQYREITAESGVSV